MNESIRINLELILTYLQLEFKIYGLELISFTCEIPLPLLPHSCLLP